VGGSFTVTITFSEPVTGFEASDISATNATITGLSGSGAVYTASVRTSGTGDATVSIPANAAIDAAANGNTASNMLNIADETVARTQELIAGYMQTRANQLVRNQPGLTRFLSKGPRGGFSFMANDAGGHFDFSAGLTSPIWFDLTGSWTKDGASDSRYVLGTVGTHRAINQNLLIGAMLQIDHLSEDTGVASLSGTGWMVGPYFASKAANHPLYFEGRLLYGESRNEISPFGTYEDRFDTTRMLAQIKVGGEISYGSTTLMPFLDASYTTDDQESYVDGLGNTVLEQGIELGQIELGMDFSKMIPVSNGNFEVWGGASGIWSHTSGSGFAATVTPDYEGSRGRVEVGINRDLSLLQKITLSGFYDGIGTSGFESHGLSFGYKAQF
jgi:hypothetical protein